MSKMFQRSMLTFQPRSLILESHQHIQQLSQNPLGQLKVRNEAKIRKRYNQVPHLTQDTTWESHKNTIKITNKSQEVCPFPAGDHKAAMNRRKSMRNTRHKNANDPQKKYRLGTVSKKNLLEGLNQISL